MLQSVCCELNGAISFVPGIKKEESGKTEQEAGGHVASRQPTALSFGEKILMQTCKNMLQLVKRHSWLSVLGVTMLIFAFPISTTITRTFLLLCVFALFLWGIYLQRKRIVFVASALLLGTFLLIWLNLPGKPGDPDTIRQTYVQSLKKYIGTFYIWGGENRIGIDCSGLIRRGLIDTNIKLGLQTLNPQLIRSAISLWWHDCSARALRDQYRGFTSSLDVSDSINNIQPDSILPGDLAVTVDGVHILAYLGNNSWIEADPGHLRVIMIDVPTDNIWFTKPVKLIRWKQMEKDSEHAPPVQASPH